MSGVYTVDPDGAGPLPPLDVYCDNSNLGGGWTLIQAFLGTTMGPRALLAPDGGIAFASPRPGVPGLLPGAVVQAIARQSARVHIRSGSTGALGSAWVTSLATAGDAGTRPVINLRNLVLLNAGIDGAMTQYFEGPRATATYLNVPFDTTCAGYINGARYPDLYWCCNNGNGLHLFDIANRWQWTSSTQPNEAMQVYLR